MLAPEKLFENFLADRKITSPRLANFGTDCLTRLTTANTTGEYTPLIATLTPLVATFNQELGDLDTTKAQQKGRTQTLQQQMAAFKKTMSAKRGVIADALGADSEAYLEFYPQGMSEYSNATIAQMPVLVKRINTAATAHAAALSPALVATLQGFENTWFATRTEQVRVKHMVSDNRSERSAARTSLETALLVTLFTIAAKFPGNAQECLTFFDFGLLEGKGRGKKKEGNSGEAKPA
jgi:hypothetical protein